MTDSHLSPEPFIGEIKMFAGNSEPAGWAFCDGRLLSPSEHTALFAVIGTTYGGDGVHNFALPDLRGRVAMGCGAGPALSNRLLGQHPGTENLALTIAHLPPHSHSLQGTNASGTSSSPGGNVLAGSSVNAYAPQGSSLVTMGATTTAVGAGTPIPALQPSLVINFIIALDGIDPISGASRILPIAPARPG